MEDEIWKPIEGYDGAYEVSNLGRVRTVRLRLNSHTMIDLKVPRIKKIQIFYTGRPYVKLKKFSRGKNLLVNRLVAKAFLPNPNNYPCINHKDENPQNNHVNNLEWCTYKYNINYGGCLERRSKTRMAKHVTCKPVIQMDEQGNEIKRFFSIREAADTIHRDPSSIYGAIVGKSPRCAGFKWKYANG